MFDVRHSIFVGIGFSQFLLFRAAFFEPRISSPVWALPRSLAATWGIDYSFFSSGYLDVSVPRLAFSMSMCSTWDIRI